jgi:hypothetical protein
MNKKPLMIILTTMVMALVVVPLLTHLLPSTHPFSTRVAYADGGEDGQAEISKAIADYFGETFGVEFSGGTKGWAAMTGNLFGKRPWQWHYSCSPDPQSKVSISVEMYSSPEDALRQFDWNWNLYHDVERKNPSRASFHGYTAYFLDYVATGDELVYDLIAYGAEGIDSSGTAEISAISWLCDVFLFSTVAINYAGGAQAVAEALLDKLEKPDNHPPTASFSINPSSPTPDDPVVCVSTSTDPDGDELLCTWYLDGDFADLDSPLELGKLDPGEHTITLHVNDGNEGTDECSITLTVGDGFVPSWKRRQALIIQGPLPKGEDFVPSWKRRQELMEQEQAVSRQEKIQKNEAAYDKSTEKAFQEEEQPAQVTVILPEEIKVEPVAPKTEDKKHKKAYILVSPEMTWWEELWTKPRAAMMHSFFEEQGYEVHYKQANTEIIKEVLLDSNTDGIAYFGHGGIGGMFGAKTEPSIGGSAVTEVSEWLVRHLAKRYMEEEGISELKALEKAAAENPNYGLSYFYNWSCYSLGDDSSNWDTRLADTVLRPGGKYWGDVGWLWGWGWLDEYEKPG